MADYAKSNMQIHQIMISEGKTSFKGEKQELLTFSLNK